MSTPLAVAVAVTGRWEAPLVAGLQHEPEVAVVRRCADLADLLAAVASGQAPAVVVSAGLPGLDGAAFVRLAAARCATVVLVEPGDLDAVPQLMRLGAQRVLAADTPAAEVARSALDAWAHQAERRPDPDGGPAQAAVPVGMWPGRPAAGAGVRPDTVDLALSGPRRSARAHRPPPEPPPEPVGEGRVVAVWGPVGAPGRTTVAVSLAAGLAAADLTPTTAALLVDADTYGSCIAQVLGLLDEAPGLAGAARAADRGVLDVAELARHAPYVSDRLRVLTGITRAHRWPELHGTAVEQVLRISRQLAGWTVVDVGFCLEQDEELAYDTAAPRRNAVTLVAVEQADVVVAVGAADPVGLQRLVRGLQDLAEVTATPPVVVVNRVRTGAVGAPARRQIREALTRFSTVRDAVLVPQDQATLDSAVLAGRTLVEQRRARALRHALRQLEDRVRAAAPQPDALTQ